MSSVVARLAIVIMAALAPLLAFQLYFESTARDVRRALMEEEAVRLLRFVEAEQQQVAEGANQLLGLLGDVAFMGTSPDTCRSAVANVLGREPRYLTLSVLGADGRMICGAPYFDPSIDLSERLYFREAVARREFVIGEVVRGTISDQPTIHMARPHMVDGKLVGVTVVAFDLRWWTKQLATIALPPGGASSIVDRNGVYLARNPDAAPVTTGDSLPEMNRYMLKGADIGLDYITGFTGTRRIVAWSPPGRRPQGLLLSVGLEVEQSFAAVTESNRSETLLMLAGMVSALIFSIFAARRLIWGPILQRSAAAEGWRGGKLSARTGIPHAGDEFGSLARAFDEMAASLEERFLVSERLAAVMRQSKEAHLTVNLDGLVTGWNSGAEALLGYAPEEIIGTPARRLIPRDLRDQAREIIRRVMTGESVTGSETERLHKNGERVPVLCFATPLRDPDGEIKSVTISLVDISELKEREQRIEFLLKEVSHRSKNMLGLVQSMIHLMRADGAPANFVERLSDRIDSLAANQDLLVRNDWRGVELCELVHAQLAHVLEADPSRFSVNGDRIMIGAAAAQALGMALHELATNAAKYGALSNPDGRVEISWRIERDAGVGTFHMSWIERGGPAVTPPADTGFGQTVIVRTVERALAAEVQLKYDADGVRWILQAPLAGVLADGRP